MRIPLVLVVAVLGLAAGIACVEEGAGPGVDTGITSAAVPTPSATVDPVATLTATATSQPSPTATPTPTHTPTPTATPTLTSTPTPTATPTPLGISAGDVLEASAAAMKALAAFHFDMDIVVSVASEDSALDIPIAVSGDFQAPDRLKASFLMDLLLLKIETEIVSIGDTEYVKDPATGEWQVSVGQGGLFTNPGRLVELEAGDIQDLALVGMEVLEGIELYHLTGVVGGGSIGFSGELEVSLWVRTDDGLIARVTAEGDIALDEAGGDLLGDLDLGTSRAAIVLSLSEFGKEVDIVAPIAGPGAAATAASTPPPAEVPEQQAAPAVDDPVAIIERLKAAMDAVGSMHFEGTIAVKASENSETALLSMRIKGDSAANNDSRVVMSLALDLGGFTASIAFETREVGGVAYTKDPLTNQWQIDEEGASSLGGDIAGPGAIEGVSAEGVTVERDILDGLEVLRITDTAPDDPELDTLVLWVGTEDFLVRRLELAARSPVGDFEGLVPADAGHVYITATLIFSGFGEPVVIERPEVN